MNIHSEIDERMINELEKSIRSKIVRVDASQLQLEHIVFIMNHLCSILFSTENNQTIQHK